MLGKQNVKGSVVYPKSPDSGRGTRELQSPGTGPFFSPCALRLPVGIAQSGLARSFCKRYRVVRGAAKEVGMVKFLSRLMVAAVMGVAVAHAETPVVVFDLPLTVECRDVTPQRYEASYQRKIFEAVIKISPQFLAGEEKDLKKLHYEISTEQQMPVVSFAPNSQVTSDVAGGAIAIQTDDHHGQLLVHYLVTPAAGDGKLTGDLNSSHAQYMLLAPKQILVASGTIERGCGVYYDLKPSTQETLQKQREFACLFDVPSTWRANYHHGKMPGPGR